MISFFLGFGKGGKCLSFSFYSRVLVGFSLGFSSDVVGVFSGFPRVFPGFSRVF